MSDELKIGVVLRCTGYWPYGWQVQIYDEYGREESKRTHTQEGAERWVQSIAKRWRAEDDRLAATIRYEL